MAKKIIKGIGKALGIGKKKKAAPVEETGPKITPLNPEEAKKRAPVKRGLEASGRIGTILSDKLGGPRQGLGG